MKIPDHLLPKFFDQFDESIHDIFQMKADIDRKRDVFIPDYRIFPKNCYVFVEFLKQDTIDSLGKQFETSLNREWINQKFMFVHGSVGTGTLYNQVKHIELQFRGSKIDLTFVFSLVWDGMVHKWELVINVHEINSNGCDWCAWCALLFAPSQSTYY